MEVATVNSDNYNKEIVGSDIPVLIDFYADWCGPCRMMKPVFHELSGTFSGKVKFATVDTEESPELSGHYGISGIPCLIMTKKGKEIGRIVGFAPAQVLKTKIEQIIPK